MSPIKLVFVSLVVLLFSIASLSLQPSIQDRIMVSEDMPAIYRYDWNRTGSTSALGNIVTPHVRWTYSTAGQYATGPLTYDIDKDGKMEIFIGEIKSDSSSRSLYALNYEGDLIWTTQGKWDLSPTAVADLNHDGTVEIAFSEMAHQPKGGLDIYLANAHDGAIIWNYTDYGVWEEGFSTSPIIYDVDGDGTDDLTLGSMDRYVYTFSGTDGSIIWKSPTFEHYIRSSSPLADLNGDGEKDFVVWDNHAVTRAYSIKTHSLLWEDRLGYGVAVTPAVGDLDGDGEPEIVFASILSGGVVVLNGDGSFLWNNTDWSIFYHNPSLVDADGDGLLDVVIGDSRQHTIIAFRGTDGSEIWNTTLLNTTWSQGPLVSADTDGDGAMEILMGSNGGLYSLEAASGNIEWTFPIGVVSSEPRVVDIDGDNIAEILFGAGDGKLYVLEQEPEPDFNPRTIGYWKHQCTVNQPKGDHVAMRQSFIEAIRNDSQIFSGLKSVEEACAILWADFKSDMAGKAKQQLLALWLNIVTGFVDMEAPVHLPSLTPANTVEEAVHDAENIILAHIDKPSLERAKDICDSLNNGIR